MQSQLFVDGAVVWKIGEEVRFAESEQTPTLVWFGRWLWMRRAASFLLQLLLELLNLRSDHGAAVWLVWMRPEKVLMIIIGFIEFFQRHDLGDDRLAEILL